MYYMFYKEKLLGLLSDQGLNQSELSRKSGVNKGTISNLCTGKARRPDIDVTVKPLAKALGVDPEFFFTKEK